MISYLVIFGVTLLLILPFYCLYKPPSLLFRYLERQFPEVLFRVDTQSRKLIALTIDDAPSQHTEEILRILRDYNASASFFVIGSQIPGNERILKQVVNEGSELGNHAMFDEPARSLTDRELADQLTAVRSQIADIYALTDSITAPPRFFRPGSGFFTARMIQLVRSLDYQLVLGNVYPHDPQIAFPFINARHILSMTRPGSIIICHDRREWTAPMLRRILPVLTERGYKVVTLTALLEAQS